MKFHSPRRVASASRRWPLPCQNNRRAIALLELIFMLLVFAGFTVLLTELFLTINRANRDSTQRATLYSRLDGAMKQLRRDVWSAKNLATPKPDTLEITTADGSQITWNGNAQTLSRKTATNPAGQSWQGLPTISFAAKGPLVALTLHTPPPPPAPRTPLPPPIPDDHMTFVSQLLER